MFSECDEYKITFNAENIPALGYKTYILKKSDLSSQPTSDNVSKEENVMENKYVKIRINSNGTLDIINKSIGIELKTMHYFVDDGEVGHPWQHIPLLPEKDIVVNSLDSKAEIKLLENTPLVAKYEVKLQLLIPETTYRDEDAAIKDFVLSWEKSWRSDKYKPVDITSIFTLYCDAKAIEVKTTVYNRCENHRLRVMFPTGIAAKYSYAETPYDVVERIIDRDETHPYYGGQNPNYPFLRFVDINDGKTGFSFISNGIREYETVDTNERILAITLVRAVEVRLCTTSVWDKLPGVLSQSLGENVFNYMLYPHTGSWDAAQVVKESELINNPLLVCQTSAEPGGNLPLKYSFLEIKGANILLSALKKAEDNNSLILRLYNPSTSSAKGTIKYFKNIKQVRFVNMNEEKIKSGNVKFKGNKIYVTVPKKKVVTLLISL